MEISNIGTVKGIIQNNKPNDVRKNNQSNTVIQQNNSAIYPSGQLLMAMTGVKQPSEEQKSKQELNSYLKTLKITPRVIKSYQQDDEGKIAVKGLINSLKKNDDETGNVKNLISQVESRKVNYSSLLYMTQKSKMSDNFKADISLMSDSSLSEEDVQNIIVPTLQNTEEAYQKRNIGDVFEVEGNDKIFIRNGEDSIKQLDISKDTYLKLFPPGERFALYQGDAGNCYMLAVFDALNSNPETREKLLSCFRQDGENLTVALPESRYPYSLKTTELSKLPDEISKYEEQYSMGAVGFKLLEHAYGVDVQERLLEDAHSILQTQAKESKGILSKMMFKKQLKEFEKDLQENPNNIIIETSMKDQQVSWHKSTGVLWRKLSDSSSRFTRPCDYYKGVGGHEEWVFQKFGMKDNTKIFDFDKENSEKLQNLFFNPENKGKYLFTAMSAGIGQNVSAEGLLDEEYGVYTRHAYSVKPDVDENGNNTVNISNPWNTSQNIVMSYEKFAKLFSAVIITDTQK